MGRPKKSRTLTIWMNGERVGEWLRPAVGPQEFMYAESWLHSPASRPISLSMPLRPSKEPYREGVGDFFDNLLPDSRQIRERIQRRFRTASINAFDLLTEIGRDCVGALQLLTKGQEPLAAHQIAARQLSRMEVGEIINRMLENTSGEKTDLNDTFRISLAGAQEKTALLYHKGNWHCPIHATPTTHILKLPMGINPYGLDLSTSVENEWLCSQIVRAYDICVPNSSMEVFGDFKALVVERFDRKLASDGRWYLRLPQEDFCQATATPPGLKYESDGGPGITKVMEMLLGSEQPEQDRRNFLKIQLVFWLLGAIDGHAKNFSIFLLPGGSYRLTPCYDILSAYPIMGHGRGKLAPEKVKMAMAVLGKNRHYRWKEIHRRHFIETAKKCGFGGMDSILEEVIDSTPTIINRIYDQIPKGFPLLIADTILDGLKACSKKLKNEKS